MYTEDCSRGNKSSLISKMDGRHDSIISQFGDSFKNFYKIHHYRLFNNFHRPYKGSNKNVFLRKNCNFFSEFSAEYLKYCILDMEIYFCEFSAQ